MAGNERHEHCDFKSAGRWGIDFDCQEEARYEVRDEAGDVYFRCGEHVTDDYGDAWQTRRVTFKDHEHCVADGHIIDFETMDLYFDVAGRTVCGEHYIPEPILTRVRGRRARR